MSARLPIRCLITLMLLALASGIYAQQKPVAPQPLREANITFVKRTWRLIDLREKQNKVATWPKNPLTKILYDAALTGRLRPYADDSLKSVLDIERFARLGSDTFYVKRLLDPDDSEGLYTMDTVVSPFNPTEKISRLLLMEEWYFDNKEGRQRVQIVAIAPLYARNIAGIELDNIPLCWFKYYDRTGTESDCRGLLVNQQMFNGGNPYNKFSYYDWLEQRNFSGFVIKESNPYDIYLADDPEVKRNGLSALIRAARIRIETQEQESDMYEP